MLSMDGLMIHRRQCAIRGRSGFDISASNPTDYKPVYMQDRG